jgi:hypothetical protein
MMISKNQSKDEDGRHAALLSCLGLVLFLFLWAEEVEMRARISNLEDEAGFFAFCDWWCVGLL